MTKRYRPFHPLSYQGLQSLNEAFAELQRRDAARQSPPTNGVKGVSAPPVAPTGQPAGSNLSAVKHHEP
jgi:hypothetical protein